MFAFLAVVIAIWLIAVGTWWVFSSASRRADVDRLKSRLLGTSKAKRDKKSSQQEAKLIRQEQKGNALAAHIVQRFQLQAKLHDLLEQAGLKWSPAKLVNSCLLAGVAGFVAAWVILPGEYRQASYLFAAAAAVLPFLYVLRQRKSRMRRFEELFPESLEFVARSMRAGHAFSVSLEMIHREFQEPLAGEFRRTFEEHNLGLPLDVSLQKLAKRVPLLDVHFFVSAVLLQKRTGGNLAEILDKLAYVIRERFKLRGRIRAISAHGRMTGIALTCIPIGVAVIMFYVNPDYVRFFFKDEVGHYMMGAAIALQLIGYLVIQKIVSIEV
jgi:tight adherence protein B